MSRVIVQIAQTLGIALLAGLGGELAKTAGERMRKKLGDKDAEADLKKKNETLEQEVKKLREELDALRNARAADADR